MLSLEMANLQQAPSLNKLSNPLGKPQKKVRFLMAVTLRPYPCTRPHSSLMAVGNLSSNQKKHLPKKAFYLNGKRFTPPPKLSGTTIKKMTFWRLPFRKALIG